MRRRNSTDDGTVTVSGPGVDVAGLPNVGAGISRALTAAERATDDGSWYVRDGGKGRFIIERRGKTTHVLPANGSEPSAPRKMADVVAL